MPDKEKVYNAFCEQGIDPLTYFNIDKVKIRLDMGHGNGLMGKKIYSLKDVDKLRNLTEKALVMIDKKLGLKADWGTW